jgi:hypothetical protein
VTLSVDPECAECVKIFDKSENQLDEDFFNKHVKYVFSKVMIAMLYQKFWMH